MSEYKTLADAPIGEWIEIKITTCSENFEEAKVLFKGKTICAVEDRDGKEWMEYIATEWRYPPNPKKQLEETILNDWQSQSIEHAYDTWMCMNKSWLLQWMLDHGVQYDTE